MSVRDKFSLTSLTLQATACASSGTTPWTNAPVCVIVAHPDDETVGCGAQLSRNATVVVVTDGAPRNLIDAKACGFQTACDYAAARGAELRSAMRVADVQEASIIQIGMPDQTAARHIATIARLLAAIIARREIQWAITHAYEGGHPDHDAVACGAFAACHLLERRGQPIALYEMPLYRQGPQGELRQSFRLEEEAAELTWPLDEKARARKQQMLACYVTQRQTLSGFAIDTERFRPMPKYDFTALPNNGRLLYEHRDWGIRTGAEWRELAGRALAELDLVEWPA